MKTCRKNTCWYIRSSTSPPNKWAIFCWNFKLPWKHGRLCFEVLAKYVFWMTKHSNSLNLRKLQQTSGTYPGDPQLPVYGGKSGNPESCLHFGLPGVCSRGRRWNFRIVSHSSLILNSHHHTTIKLRTSCAKLPVNLWLLATGQGPPHSKQRRLETNEPRKKTRILSIEMLVVS